ncbi:hypothetical protein C8J56DRAFT_879913 [Mycena floridula]|nr:hypothetical protein C8J56DRAFT_879913 [Mycena floridula]
MIDELWKSLGSSTPDRSQQIWFRFGPDPKVKVVLEIEVETPTSTVTTSIKAVAASYSVYGYDSFLDHHTRSFETPHAHTHTRTAAQAGYAGQQALSGGVLSEGRGGDVNDAFSVPIQFGALSPLEIGQALAEWNRRPWGPKPQAPEPPEDFFPPLKIMMASKVTHKSLQRAETLLEDFMVLPLSSPITIGLFMYLRKYATMALFTTWAFLTERLNKVLKNMNSNNHLGGELEISMMREFSRASRMDAKARQQFLRKADGIPAHILESCKNAFSGHPMGLCFETLTILLRQMLQDPQENSVVKTVVRRMLAETGEAIGTVADAGTSSSFVSHTPSAKTTLTDIDRVALRTYYNSLQKGPFHLELESNPQPGSTPITRYVQQFNFALLDGRRISPTLRTLRSSKGSSIVKIMSGGQRLGGEVRELFLHKQTKIDEPVVFTCIDWMDYADVSPVKTDIWKDFTTKKASFSNSIGCHCLPARGTVRTTEPEYWITTTMFGHIILFDDDVEEQE